MLGVAIASIINIWRIKTAIHFSLKQTLKRSILIVMLTLLMTLFLITVRKILDPFLSYGDGQIESAIVLIIYAALGGGLYFLIASKTNLLQKIL